MVKRTNVVGGMGRTPRRGPGLLDASPAGRARHAEGTVRRADPELIWLGAPSGEATETGLRHGLPQDVRLEAIVGRHVRITIQRGPAAGPDAAVDVASDRTLTIQGEAGRGEAGRLWLIARSGPVRGVQHALHGGVVLHAALSQRPCGPLVIGTSELQWLVSPGAVATLPLPGGPTLAVLFVERRADDTASYVLGDASLFHATTLGRSVKSTRRS